jgi:hypothetical protein
MKIKNMESYSYIDCSKIKTIKIRNNLNEEKTLKCTVHNVILTIFKMTIDKKKLQIDHCY